MTTLAYHTPVRLLAHDATERDNRCDAGEVEEDDRRETLHMETVGEVADERSIPEQVFH